MKEDTAYTTMRFWEKTRKILKLIAAIENETIIAIIDRLAVAELERISKRDGVEYGRKD